MVVTERPHPLPEARQHPNWLAADEPTAGHAATQDGGAPGTRIMTR